MYNLTTTIKDIIKGGEKNAQNKNLQINKVVQNRILRVV